MVEMAKFNVQRVITPKVGKPELRFMCFTSVKFHENSLNGIRVMKRTQNYEALMHRHSKFQNV